MSFRGILPKIFGIITRHSRERVEIKWSQNSWTHNFFRFLELIFWRRSGIRAEMSSSGKLINGTLIIKYDFFTIESLIAHTEGSIRFYFTNTFWRPIIDQQYRLNPIIPLCLSIGIFGSEFVVKTNTHSILPSILGMAIAFDATTGGNTGAGASSITISHTCTGSNLVIVGGTNVGASHNCTGMTYNSVSLTAIRNDSVVGAHTYIQYLLAPATGANNLVISLDSSTGASGGAISLTGVQQSGQPDANNGTTAVAASSISVSITTVADNAWIVSIYGQNNSGGTLSANNGQTKRWDQKDTVAATGIEHGGGATLGPVTPAGATTIGWSEALSINSALSVASFAPAVSFMPKSNQPILQSVNRSNSY